MIKGFSKKGHVAIEVMGTLDEITLDTLSIIGTIIAKLNNTGHEELARAYKEMLQESIADNDCVIWKPEVLENEDDDGDAS